MCVLVSTVTERSPPAGAFPCGVCIPPPGVLFRYSNFLPQSRDMLASLHDKIKTLRT